MKPKDQREQQQNVLSFYCWSMLRGCGNRTAAIAKAGRGGEDATVVEAAAVEPQTRRLEGGENTRRQLQANLQWQIVGRGLAVR